MENVRDSGMNAHPTSSSKPKKISTSVRRCQRKESCDTVSFHARSPMGTLQAAVL